MAFRNTTYSETADVDDPKHLTLLFIVLQLSYSTKQSIRRRSALCNGLLLLLTAASLQSDVILYVIYSYVIHYVLRCLQARYTGTVSHRLTAVVSLIYLISPTDSHY